MKKLIFAILLIGAPAFSPVLAQTKDFRRIATRYGKLARNYFSALCLVAAVAFWL
jgi:hypothetical protein